MEGLVKQEWGSLSVHLRISHFLRIKTHQQGLFPHLEVIQIGLQLQTAILLVDCQVQGTTVCEQVDGGLNILQQVVNVHEEKSRSNRRTLGDP